MKERGWGGVPFVGEGKLSSPGGADFSPPAPSRGCTTGFFMSRSCTISEILTSSVPLSDHPSHPPWITCSTPSADPVLCPHWDPQSRHLPLSLYPSAHLAWILCSTTAAALNAPALLPLSYTHLRNPASGAHLSTFYVPARSS